MWCAACLMAAGMRAQSGETVFTGKVMDYAGQDTLFCYFGNPGEGYDTLDIRKDGTFALSKPMKTEADVTVFWEGRQAREHKSFNVVLAPGKKTHAEINPLVFSPDSVTLGVTFSGDNAEKSDYMNLFNYYFSHSQELTDETLVRLPDFRACRAYVDERIAKLSALLARVDDPDFVAEKQGYLKQAARSTYLSYAEAKEKAGTKMGADADFMVFTKTIQMNDTAAVDDICGYLAWYYAAHADRYKPLSSDAAQLKCLKALVSDQDVRNRVANRYMMGQFFLMQFGGSPMKDVLEQYLDVATDTTYVPIVRNQLDILVRNEPGRPAIDFPVNTPEDKTVGFKSLVGGGKVAYVDFWATWCVPCRREIPYLEKLVEHYKDNDRVRVISVSIDTNVAAWKKMIAADKPAWEQYNIPNPDDSEGVKYYNITGIPRFMLFDREGKLYQSSASRPSDEATKALIDSLIK